MKKDKNQIKEIAKNTIIKEAKAVEKLASFVDDDFSDVIELIFNSKGRVIISGIGKSAIIANKMVATLNSTGTPSIFLHAADAIHGDLGLVLEDDVVIVLSKSGNTPEIKVLVPLIKNFGNKLIAIVSNTDSFLAKQADYILKATVDKEACPNNLAPTASTTAQLVIGDALAMTLLECRGFTSDDFAKFHPGGALGKQLYLKVSDIFYNNEKPVVNVSTKINEVILEISSKRLGATAVINSENKLVGVITDGDIRRMLQNQLQFDLLCAEDIMSENPKTIDKDMLAINAFNLMEENKITQLIISEDGTYLGMIHLHDLLREGIA
jgi:arabinose-5-phosphate isomerase